MTALIGPIIGLANSILQLIATEKALSYIDQLNSIQKDLLAEVSKGYDSDDAKVENLYSQLQIALQAVNNELALYKNSPVQPASPSVPSTPSSS